MAITLTSERVLAQTGTEKSHDIEYLVLSSAATVADQLVDVTSWIQYNLPASYLGQDLSGATYAEIGAGWYSVKASYSTDESQKKEKSEPPQIDDEPDWRFSISTQTQNIKLSKGLYSVVPTVGNEWTLFLNGPYPIGFDGKDTLGVDVLMPVASWDETYYFDPDDVDQTYRLNCLSLVGKVNNATFRGAAARQVLLQSVEGNKKGAAPWAVTFSFLYKGNYSGDVVFEDGEQRTISTIGHQHIDIRDGKGTIEGKTITVPKMILIHDIYEFGDFSLLNIGT